MSRRAHVIISGVVQGVAFRQHTAQEAARLGVTGWVRNLPTGEVEGCFEGDDAAVTDLLRWCHTGPRLARVESVTATEEPHRGEFATFSIRF
jgi:acylphosphatase